MSYGVFFQKPAFWGLMNCFGIANPEQVVNSKIFEYGRKFILINLNFQLRTDNSMYYLNTISGM